MGMGSEGRVPPTLLCGAAAQVPDRLSPANLVCVSFAITVESCTAHLPIPPGPGRAGEDFSVVLVVSVLVKNISGFQ